jgi:lipopolysaccharide biosynthesis glycosyltransferase
MASDDNYIPYLMITAKSISLHSSDEYIYDVTVLSSGLEPQNIRKLRHLELDNVNISIVNMEKNVKPLREKLRATLRDYYSEAIFYRMFIASMYPRLTRAVYIDCDTVLVDDIAKLYFTDIGDNILGAVADESIPNVPEFCDYVKNWVGVPVSKYVNSGVLLINLKEYRQNLVLEKFVDLIEERNFATVAPDQDYLNYLCKGRIYYLDSGWNKQPKADNLLPIVEQHLIHYNLYNKPWHYSDVAYSDVFWNVAKMTPYYTDILMELVEYTDEQKEKDIAGGARLVEHAAKLAERQDGFKHYRHKSASRAMAG